MRSFQKLIWHPHLYFRDLFLKYAPELSYKIYDFFEDHMPFLARKLRSEISNEQKLGKMLSALKKGSVKDAGIFFEISNLYEYIGEYEQSEAFFKEGMKHVSEESYYDLRKSVIAFSLHVQAVKKIIDGKNINLIILHHPRLERMINLSRTEKNIIRTRSPVGDDEFYQMHKELPYVTKEYRQKIKTPNAITLTNKKFFIDYNSKYVNTSMGYRVVVGQPNKWGRTIWTIGSSRYCNHSEDKYTIPSCLQFFLNKDTDWIRVVDKSIPRTTFIFQRSVLENIPIKSGDTILLEDTSYPSLPNEYKEKICSSKGIKFYDFNKNFMNRPKNSFIDLSHMTYIGNLEVARIIYDNFLSIIPSLNDERVKRMQSYLLTHDDSNAQDKVSMADIDHAYKDVPSLSKGKIGSIVMNCNPITNGHMHLITTASNIVNFLYIFIVEENKSFFPFADRIQMVREATAHLQNIIVVQSGRFILSVDTFPEYFEKDMKQEALIDTSYDIDIFGKYVAKKFNISVRFFGEEPTDCVTRQYNEEAKTRLPQYGVRVIEIPRLKIGDNAISASHVRHLLAQKKWDDIAKICPKSTVDYLRNMT